MNIDSPSKAKTTDSSKFKPKSVCVPANFKKLAGAVGLGQFNAKEFEASCAKMQRLGYSGVFFSDIFIQTLPREASFDESDLLFTEDDHIYLSRPKSQLAEIRNILQKYGLTIPIGHFLQVLPPPGVSLEWIFPWHEKVLDVAAFMDVKSVTTHIGSMLGLPCEQYMGDYVKSWKSGSLSMKGLLDAGREVYGKDKLIPDLLYVYRQLCSTAADRGIQVSVETGVDEFPAISCDIDQMIAFIKDVGAPNLGICLDAGHCNFQNMNNAEVIRKAGSLLIETHFHDNFGKLDSHYPIGIGTVNWREIIKEMISASYQGPITFEQGNHSVNAQNWHLFLNDVEQN